MLLVAEAIEQLSAISDQQSPARNQISSINNAAVRLLPDADGPESRYKEVQPEDVVLLPAFGVTVGLQDPSRRNRR